MQLPLSKTLSPSRPLLRGVFHLCLLFLPACVWNSQNFHNTEQFFNAHQSEFEQAAQRIAQFGCEAMPSESIQTQFRNLSNAEFSIGIEALNEIGCVIEFTPVDFYYVIVYAESEAIAKTSSAFRDEGSIKRKLADHWYLIQRGWM